ncbi:septation protein IspZ [Rhizobacter sp. Root1221]|uniref:septation protein IspZ n=1 Tax=Rhizobacter sp. Root1221 TaxID=1736433 RepID=UPI0009E777B2|nr:septation protein IspZ [Rhizobacter sp. Root1221]
MSDNIRYAPPTAQVGDIAEASPRGSHGLKLSVSLFWRLFLLHTVLLLPVAAVLGLSDLGQSAMFLMLKPSLFFAVVAAVLASSLLVFRPGLLFFVWGYRLHLPFGSWRKFTWSFCTLYLVLGIVNVGVAFTTPVAVWVQFKTFVPFFAIVALCVAAPRFLARPNPSIEPSMTTPRPFGLGSFAAAGFVGGPLAALYLAARNRMNHAPSREASMLLGFHVVASGVWLWTIFNAPRDALSQLVVHLPQVALWSLVSWPLLRRSFAAYSKAGGSFRSVWVAAGIGLLFAIGLRLVFRLLFA